ncbi:hypothetical protein CGZ80_10610 [Rhodopirellula sp. MGV]|nr:hypothetical protein CGZ80_10610 [Rhodopirellula sp. MGV]PNY36350.1 hypothetical protein C2E31_13000 [Rhodopirellula baltica]
MNCRSRQGLLIKTDTSFKHPSSVFTTVRLIRLGQIALVLCGVDDSYYEDGFIGDARENLMIG